MKTKKEAIINHIEKCIGKVIRGFHEIYPFDIHYDFFWAKTSLHNTNVNVIVTIGLSDYPMNTPSGLENLSYAELCIILPEYWEISTNSFIKNKYYWPFGMLVDIMMYPYEHNTFICNKKVFNNGNPPKKYIENIDFIGCFIIFPFSITEEFYHLKYKKKIINFYCAIPLYPEELLFINEKGLDSLLMRFKEYEINEIIDIKRKNTCL